MAYVGNTPADKTLKLEKQQFTTSATTSYTLNHSVSDPQDIALFINNVRQNPNSAYSVSGTALTISEATASTDTMYCVFLGRAIGTTGIGAGEVTKDKLDLISDSTAGLTVKGDGGSNDGYLQLNCRVNSHGIKLKSPPHSAGATYTLTFPNSVSAGKFLKTDGSGNLSFASAGGITEADQWRLSADTNQNTNAVISTNWERVDDATFNYIGTGLTESSGVFTFPSTGIYLIITSVGMSLDASDVSASVLIKGTADNSSYDTLATANIGHDGGYADVIIGITNTVLFDVTNTSTHKLRFESSSFSGVTRARGNTDTNFTHFTVLKLGDT